MAATSSITNLFDVTGIVAVVTGGGSGLGLEMTRALATNGAKKVYIIGRRRHILDQAVAEIGQDNIIPIQCDVTDPDALKSAVAFIEKDIGYINLLVANSGIAGPSGSVPSGSSIPQVQEALLRISMQEFTNTFHVNCTAVFYTAIAFLGLLDAGNQTQNDYARKGCRSQVIATSSIGSFNRRITAGFAYGASKAATTMLLKVLATYLVPYRIRANVLCPGLFPTDLTTDLIHGKSPTEEGAFPLDQIPAERAGTPEDIMGPLLYLASRAGAYCNGNCVLTDGGRLSVMPATY
ncbi:3-oxoacyl-reductase [Aspergillus japonicus CBS 114.51]|uniref:3-oxoacyl-reductase n=1 Tax=Aspergillus japonicus CBS 114.51 TaxID=1448312 RepID=A0A8T8WVZ5_ASPJA|nr:3-oxoacyl-reductase [Aspergillus japonicus CBS 114.51]RAH80006.1 3-oxoacyl-reductase [Aspergillus japonicus CBS 114.51]